MDSLYLKDQNTGASNQFKEFHHFNRSSGDYFADFIIKFEKLCTLVWYGFPDTVKMYFLLSAANTSEENEKLTWTTCWVLDYKHMKYAAIRIFRNPCGCEENSNVDSLLIKECFLGASRGRYQPNHRKKEDKESIEMESQI